MEQEIDEILLTSVDEETNDQRWLITSTKVMQERTQEKWNWFNDILNRKSQYINIKLGYDDFLQKPVIIKGVEICEGSRASIAEVRETLEEQLHLLNTVQSPLFPEPLDWFDTLNARKDNSSSEIIPVLVLDWIPGLTLDKYIKSNRLKFENGETNYSKIARIAIRVVKFIKELNSKGFTYMSLAPQHIVLLKNDIPRFIGLSNVCSLENGLLNNEHVNFKHQIKGYSAPELSYSKRGMQISYDVNQINAYSLGVLLHQMLVNSNEFNEDNINNNGLVYPNSDSERIIRSNPKGEKWHELLTLLCNEKIENRLKDFDEIEYRLHELGGCLIKSYKAFVNKEKAIVGTVKWYDFKNDFGYITSSKGKEYQIKSSMIANYSDIIAQKLIAGAKIEYDITTKGNKIGVVKEYISDIVIINEDITSKTIITKKRKKSIKDILNINRK